MSTKRSALRLMQGCGMFAAARWLSSGMARILMYHNFCGPGGTDPNDVSATAVRAQFEYLRRHFKVVPLAQIVKDLKSGMRLKDHTVALTIDDGRRNCHQFLFPLLQEFEIPATFFVVSSFIRREDWLWTDKVLWLSEQPNRPGELDAGKIEEFFRMLNTLRPEARNARIASIAGSMHVAIPREAPTKYEPCSWNELREMAQSGLVEIGSHTVSHPILASVTDKESWEELTVSRAQIEEGLGRSVSLFCFPNGKPEDYRLSQVRQVSDAGYSCAVVTSFGMIDVGADPLELPRIGVSGRTDALTFAKLLDGAEYYQARLQRSI
jgi:peptidoglycan/xylan/chitin deacetylase (PgdA/CDA1 family)